MPWTVSCVSLSAFDMVGVALDAEDLTYIREIQVLIEAVADPDFA